MSTFFIGPRESMTARKYRAMRIKYNAARKGPVVNWDRLRASEENGWPIVWHRSTRKRCLEEAAGMWGDDTGERLPLGTVPGYTKKGRKCERCRGFLEMGRRYRCKPCGDLFYKAFSTVVNAGPDKPVDFLTEYFRPSARE